MTTAREPIRIGIVGAGANTRDRHIPGFRALVGVELAGVVNRSAESSERVAREFNIPRTYETWQDLLDDDEIDAVMIGTWPYLHCPVTLAALAAGKHVLTEARMAMNLEEAKDMLAASRQTPELVTQIVPSPFTFPVDKAIQQRVLDGYLGEVLSIDMRGSPPGFVNREAPMHWRQDRSLSGVNIMTMGIWYESILRWTGGVTNVMARTKVVVPVRRDAETGEPRAASVPEHVEVIGDLAGGGIFRLQVSSITGLANPPEFWIYGSEGTLRFDFGTRTLWGGRRGDRSLSQIEIPPEQQYSWRVEAEFVGAIRGEEPVTRTSFADGVRYMAFTQAVAESAATGQAVPILY
jgi:predicted dehydrogenase